LSPLSTQDQPLHALQQRVMQLARNARELRQRRFESTANLC
jgi:hypothetical protein